MVSLSKSWSYPLVLALALPNVALGPCCCQAVLGAGSTVADAQQPGVSQESGCPHCRLKQQSGGPGQVKHDCRCDFTPRPPISVAGRYELRLPAASAPISSIPALGVPTQSSHPELEEATFPVGPGISLNVLYCCWLA